MSGSYSKQWRGVIRSMILVRDDFKCVVCGHESISNHVHHLNNSPGCNHSANLVTLCPMHHQLVGRYKLKLVELYKPLDIDFHKPFDAIIQRAIILDAIK